MTAPKTIRLNPREAPKGYRAVKAPTGCNDCDGCDFLSQGGYCKMRYPLAGRPCFHERRKDGQNVIFKRVKKARRP